MKSQPLFRILSFTLSLIYSMFDAPFCRSFWCVIPFLLAQFLPIAFRFISTNNTPSQFSGKLITTYHYDDVIMTMLASQITSLTVVYSIVYSGVNQRKHQSSASLAFVREIHRGPVNFPHKWPVTRKMFPFDDVIMHKHTRKMYMYAFMRMPIHLPFKMIILKYECYTL